MSQKRLGTCTLDWAEQWRGLYLICRVLQRTSVTLVTNMAEGVQRGSLVSLRQQIRGRSLMPTTSQANVAGPSCRYIHVARATGIRRVPFLPAAATGVCAVLWSHGSPPPHQQCSPMAGQPRNTFYFFQNFISISTCLQYTLGNTFSWFQENWWAVKRS